MGTGFWIQCTLNTPTQHNTHNMAIPDLGSMDKDALSALAKQLYDQSYAVFAEKFNMEHEIKKNEVEIHALELEVNDMHGKFIIPALKKVSNFKLMGGEEA